MKNSEKGTFGHFEFDLLLIGGEFETVTVIGVCYKDYSLLRYSLNQKKTCGKHTCDRESAVIHLIYGLYFYPKGFTMT